MAGAPAHVVHPQPPTVSSRSGAARYSITPSWPPLSDRKVKVHLEPRPKRFSLAVVGCAVVLVATGCSAEAPEPTPVPNQRSEWFLPANPPRAFTAESWWNTPVPRDAPSHPRANAILDYMQTGRQASDGCVRLAGASKNEWGQPVYWSRPTDNAYDVAVDIPQPRPPELGGLRIPEGARAAATSDAEMTIFDMDGGYVVALTGADFDPRTDTWSARGATITYLDSNGLHARTGRSDVARNTGSHRGNNGATMVVRHDEVTEETIEHVLKVASGPEASKRFVFPMIGSDGDSENPDAPPQGLRFRIKPTVDLSTPDLAPEARGIAQALQTYGFYVGDSSGVTALKLENTRAEGRGQLWELPSTALCSLPLRSDLWDVLPEGYEPSGSVG